MENDILIGLLKTLGPWGAFIFYFLYTLLKQPLTNFVQNLKFNDMISFRKNTLAVKRLQTTVHSMELALKKEREIGTIIDKLRDKYNFKYCYVSIFSNGETDLLGMGKYKFSIEYEKCRHDVPSIRHLYQNHSLIPYFPVITTATKKVDGTEYSTYIYKTSLININLEQEEEQHPLKHRFYTHGITSMYLLLILKEVRIEKGNELAYIPIGDITCAVDESTGELDKNMISDLYLAKQNVLEIINKYSLQNLKLEKK